jgi:hypothetical protein
MRGHFVGKIRACKQVKQGQRKNHQQGNRRDFDGLEFGESGFDEVQIDAVTDTGRNNVQRIRIDIS